MKLDIVIPHYTEPWEIVEPLFDSIKLQRAMDFKDIHVIVVNDGDKLVFDKAIFDKYPYTIDYYIMPHGGVSAARNYGMDKGDGDYVMFCDCDDSFSNIYGLHMLLDQMQYGFDAITSVFLVEYQEDDGSLTISYKDKDVTFVHGKAYKRQHLIDKDIRWNPNLTIHEDGYFNCLALMCAEKKKQIDTPFYTWKFRADSVASKTDDAFVLKTYKNVIDVRMALVKEAKKRGYQQNARGFIAKTVLDSYYDMNKTVALKPENKEIVNKAEREFKRFYMKHRKEYNSCTVDEIAQVMVLARTEAYSKGLRIEQKTLREWLNHIVYEVKE